MRTSNGGLLGEWSVLAVATLPRATHAATVLLLLGRTRRPTPAGYSLYTLTSPKISYSPWRVNKYLYVFLRGSGAALGMALACHGRSPPGRQPRPRPVPHAPPPPDAPKRKSPPAAGATERRYTTHRPRVKIPLSPVPVPAVVAELRVRVVHLPAGRTRLALDQRGAARATELRLRLDQGAALVTANFRLPATAHAPRRWTWS